MFSFKKKRSIDSGYKEFQVPRRSSKIEASKNRKTTASPLPEPSRIENVMKLKVHEIPGRIKKVKQCGNRDPRQMETTKPWSAHESAGQDCFSAAKMLSSSSGAGGSRSKDPPYFTTIGLAGQRSRVSAAFSTGVPCEIIQYNEDQSKIMVVKNRQRRWGGPESVPTAPDLSDPNISIGSHFTVMLLSITAVTLQTLGSIDKGDQFRDKEFSKDHVEVTKRDPIRQTPFRTAKCLTHVATFCHICRNATHSSVCQNRCCRRDIA
ncbi:hypothetical protein EDB83DRAFT_2555503 [Lactarius deliciosus]|nr:hypothetical protein EDB83DRAFT_2555503 [Lactarius deliciosus]